MAWFSSEIGATDVVSSLEDLTDVNISNKSGGDIVSYDATEGEWVNKPKSLYPSAPITTWAEYQQLVDNDEDDPDAEYYIDDIDVAEAYYEETSGQTALTGATSLTFTNSHIKPTADIRILAEPASCKVATNPQYKVSAKLSSVGNGTATITFPALAENTEFWLLIECPLATLPSEVESGSTTAYGLTVRWAKTLNVMTFSVSGDLSSSLSTDTELIDFGCVPLTTVNIKSANHTGEYDFKVGSDGKLRINGTLSSGFRVRAVNGTFIYE